MASKKKDTRCSIILPFEIIEWLKQEGSKQQRNFSAQVRWCINEVRTNTKNLNKEKQ